MPASLHVRIGLLGLALLLAPACGDTGGDDTSPAAATDDSVAGGGATRTPKKTVDPATTGSLSGVVRYAGEVPEPAFFRMIGESYCMQQNPPDGGFFDNRLLVVDGRVQNAFVWIREGLEDYDFETPETTVSFDQVNCLYTPRVLGIQAGQKLEARTSDPILHNVHTKPKNNRPQNFAMPAHSPPAELRLRRAEVMVEVVCDVHAWMRGWIGVVDHPCFGVTGEDGAFSLQGVPPGDYVLGVWHERLGEQQIPVTVAPGGDTRVEDVVYAP